MAAKVTPTKSYLREFGGGACRLCSSESARLQLQIFNKSGNRKQMAEKIFEATGLRIDNNSHLYVTTMTLFSRRVHTNCTRTWVRRSWAQICVIFAVVNRCLYYKNSRLRPNFIPPLHPSLLMLLAMHAGANCKLVLATCKNKWIYRHELSSFVCSLIIINYNIIYYIVS